MRKSTFGLAILVMTFAGLVFAGRAAAYPGVSFGTPCNVCHSGAGVNPVATLVSNNGTTATYNVSSGGLEWAVFSGSTRIGGQPGATGQFSVAVGGSYTLFAVQGYPGPLGQTAVNPTAPVTMFTLSASAGPNGHISPGSTSVASGGSQMFTFTPNSGFHVADVLVDGASQGAVGTYTFTNVTADHTISVTFAMNVLTTFTLTPSAGANGSISPATSQTVVAGSSFTFMIVPSTGFHVADVLVDGSSVGAVGSYTFSGIAADHTISATFAANATGMFTITPQAGAHGSITPSAAVTVASGGSATFAFTPAPGYHIEAVAVDGVQIVTVSSYTFTNVSANHVIAVSFSADAENPLPTSIGLKVSSTSVRRNAYVRLTGTLKDGAAAMFFGCRLTFQYRKPGSSTWVTISRVMVSASTGKATTGRIHLTRRGRYYFRAKFLGTDDFKPSTSPTIRTTVR